MRDLPNCKAGTKFIWDEKKKKFFPEIYDKKMGKNIGYPPKMVIANQYFFWREDEIYIKEVKCSHGKESKTILITNASQKLEINSHVLYNLLINSSECEDTTHVINLPIY